VHPQSDRQPHGNPHPNNDAYVLVPLLQAWQPPHFIGGTYEYQQQWPQEAGKLAELGLEWQCHIASRENNEQQQDQIAALVSTLHDSTEVSEQPHTEIAHPGEALGSTAGGGNLLHAISPQRPRMPMRTASNQSTNQGVEASLAAHRSHRRNPSEAYSKHSVEPEPHFYLEDDDNLNEDDDDEL
jgi:hypothetical protein